MAVKSVSIHIEEGMLKKLAYIAEYEGRSVNSHMLVLVRNAKKISKQRTAPLTETSAPIRT